MKWHLEKRNIVDLKHFHKNPRVLTEEQQQQLEQSLKKFGLIDKPIINTDNTVIGGHQRLKTLELMGEQEIEVYVPDAQLSDKDVEELNIRLNKNTGEWDWDILANEWDKDDLLAWGFTEEEFGLGIIDEDEILTPQNEEECQVCEACGQKIKAKKRKNNGS